MLVPEHSRPTRGRSTRKYYIGAGRAGEWGLKSVPGSLGRRLGLPSVSHLGLKAETKYSGFLRQQGDTSLVSHTTYCGGDPGHGPPGVRG
jgi:hypothetical protein